MPPTPRFWHTHQLRANTLKTPQPVLHADTLSLLVLLLLCRGSLLFDMHKVILQLGSLWLEAWQAAVPGTPAKKIF